MTAMTREDIKACCKKISPGYSGDSVCDFADNVQTLGFIDTSQGQNGSRGIVFSTNHMMLNTDGTLRIIFYRNITDVKIIDSYEDAFSDELEIVCAGEEFRVSNCSLNKAELKSLLDKLCDGGLRGEGPARITPPPPKPPANTIAVTATPPEPVRSPSPIAKEENTDDLMKKTPSLEISSNEKRQTEQVRNDIPPHEDMQTEQTKNDIQPRENRENEQSRRVIVQNESLKKDPPKPDPLPGDSGEDIVFESDTPVIFETVINRNNNSKPNNLSARDDDFNNTEERLKIQNMTTEETMSFLAQSLSEINAPVFDEPEPEPKPMPELVQHVIETPPATITDYNPPFEAPQKSKGLTVEPVWGDIYIKASRNLRELCESNRLSMKQIEAELSDKLLDSTKAFAEITADESRVPKVLIPKITELKAAAQNFDQYFQLGEDIAVRAMFFMLYQMLSYSDRIVETPETKEGLNDFFRRFGPAGIMLSMLDMRV